MTPEAVKEAVRTHKAFIYKWALREARRTGRELDDCVQDAYVSFTQACQKWVPRDGESDANIRTYASKYMSRAIGRRLIASERDKRQRSDVSMDAPLAGGDDVRTLHDVLESTAELSPEDALLGRERVDALDAALEKLEPRARQIVRARFYGEETLEQIGKRYGLTAVRIQQIEAEALRRLKRFLVGEFDE